jgi:hypothetical protein
MTLNETENRLRIGTDKRKSKIIHMPLTITAQCLNKTTT